MTDVTNNSTETSSAVVENAAVSSSNVDFKANLSEDLRNDPSISSFKTVEDMAKSFVSSQRMLGNRIPIPTKEASKEVRDEFYQKLSSIPEVVRLPSEDDPEKDAKLSAVYDRLGRPSDPSRYKVEVPEDLVNAEYFNSVKALAHKVGLTQAQFQALADNEVALLKAQADSAKKEHTENSEFLKKTWGNAYENNKQLASAVLTKFAEKYPNEVNRLAETSATNPVIFMMAAELAKSYQESGSIELGAGVPGGKSPEQAQDEINDILRNSKHPYHNNNMPGHDEAVIKMSKLFEDAYPQPKV
jgi:hypothetical protein